MVEVLKPSSPYFRQLFGVLMFCIVVLFLLWRVYRLQPTPSHLRGKLDVPHSFNHITVHNLTYLEEPMGPRDVLNSTLNEMKELEDIDYEDGDAHLLKEGFDFVEGNDVLSTKENIATIVLSD